MRLPRVFCHSKGLPLLLTFKEEIFYSRDVTFFENQSFYPPKLDPPPQHSTTYINSSNLFDNWEHFWLSNPPQNLVQEEKQHQEPISHLEQPQNQEQNPAFRTDVFPK